MQYNLITTPGGTLVQPGNKIRNGAGEEPVGDELKAILQKDADQRNAKAEELGIKTRYEVVADPKKE